MPELDRIRVAHALAAMRSSESHVFGAEAHDFDVNPPLSEAVVAEFERAHGIHLPSDYRGFLTSIGNGGAGPFYGVFPLGKIDDHFALRDWGEEDIGVLSKAFPFEEHWNDLSAKPDDDLVHRDEAEYWKQMEAFERVYWSPTLVNGALPICHQGCALRIVLVVTGEQAGYLWDDRRSEYGGIKPISLADGSPATFSDWYNEWLTS
jgi:SMI1 / KNR4 family (SUKH-1)